MSRPHHWSFTKAFHHEPYPAISPTRPELSAKGKLVVVIGASRGIGLAIAEAFATAGAANIAITGRSQRTLDATKSKLEHAHANTKFHAVELDATDDAATQSNLGKLASSIQPIDVLVANAGTLNPGPLLNIGPATVRQVFDVNTFGVLSAANALVAHGAKDAVFICTNAGIAHLPPMLGPVGAYAASKAATAKMLEFLQVENPGFRFFDFHPGAIETELADNVPKHLLVDTLELPGAFCVWLASGEADFLKGKLVWANWDADELKARKDEILADPRLFTLALRGWGN